MSEKKQPDVLDQLKAVEKRAKLHLLLKKVVAIRKMAREINYLKEKSQLTLEALGIDEKEIKRIIDYVNEQPGVKLSADDRKQLRDDINKTVDDEKRQGEEQITKLLEEKPQLYDNFMLSSISTGAWNLDGSTSTYTVQDAAGTMTVTAAGSNAVSFGGDLEIKL